MPFSSDVSLFIVPEFPLHSVPDSQTRRPFPTSGAATHGVFSRTRFRRFFVKLAITAANEEFRNHDSIRKATDYLARINIESSPRILTLDPR